MENAPNGQNNQEKAKPVTTEQVEKQRKILEYVGAIKDGSFVYNPEKFELKNLSCVDIIENGKIIGHVYTYYTRDNLEPESVLLYKFGERIENIGYESYDIFGNLQFSKIDIEKEGTFPKGEKCLNGDGQIISISGVTKGNYIDGDQEYTKEYYDQES